MESMRWQKRVNVRSSTSVRQLARSSLSNKNRETDEIYVYRHCDELDSTLPRQSIASGHAPSICIVGAGLAGLRCADVLLKNGVQDVTIFEARDRIGGRIAQSRSQSLHGPLDLGPNWIHGANNNPISSISVNTKTSTFLAEEDIAYTAEGKSMPKDIVSKYSECLWDLIKKAFDYSKSGAEISPHENLYDFIERETNSSDFNPELSAEVLLQVADMWSLFVGESIHKQSLKFLWLEECLEGENSYVSGTYSSILSSIAKLALSRAKVHLSSPVSYVSFDPLAPSKTAVTVRGIVHEFDECILTAPLGWLKKNAATAISPPLPDRTTAAISSLGFSRLEKVYLTFKHAFWRSSSDEANSFGILFLAPSYAPSTNPKKWMLECMDLSLLPGTDAQPTLLFYLYPPCSTHIVESVAKLSAEEGKKFLIDFFKPYFSRLPNYNDDEVLSNGMETPEVYPNDPVGVLATAWQLDPWAGYGSYTNFPIGLTDGGGDVEALRRGSPDRRLWLAGEHTAPFVALGTTTGAYWAGEKVAQRILKIYGVKCEEDLDGN